MAIKIVVERYVTDTSTGFEDYTTTKLNGLTPKAALIFITNAETDGTVTANLECGFAMLDDNSNRFANTHASENNSDPTDTTSFQQESYGLLLRDSADTNKIIVTTHTFIPNGVTIGWNTVQFSESYLWTIVFFAGDDLDAHVGEITSSVSTSSQTHITGPGFAPEIVFFSHTESSSSFATPSFGIAVNDFNETSRTWKWQDKSGTTGTDVVQQIRNDSVWMSFDSSQNFESRTYVTKFNQDGFSLQSATANSTGEAMYLAITTNGKHDFKLDSIDSGTATGSDATTGVGFEPEFVLMGLTDCQAENTTYSNADAGAGGIVVWDPDDQYSWSVSTEDAANPSDTQSIQDNQAINFASGDGTTQHAATLTSFDSDGWTLNYSTADTTARKWFYLAVSGEKPPTSVGRVFWYNENLAEQSAQSSTLQTHTSLTFTPNANTDVAIFFSAQVNINDASGNELQVGLYKSTDSNLDETLGHPFARIGVNEEEDWQSFQGVRVESYGASPGEQTFEVRYSLETGSTDTVKCRAVSIFALQLETGDEFSTTTGTWPTGTTSSSTYINIEQLLFTPASQGSYLIAKTGVMGERGSTSSSHIMRSTVNNPTGPGPAQSREPDNSLDCHVFWELRRVTDVTAQQTYNIDFRVESAGTSSGYGKTTIVALREDNLKGVFFSREDVDGNTTSTTFQDYHSLDFTPRPSDPLLYLGKLIHAQNAGNAVESQYVLDGSIIQDIINYDAQDTTDQYPGGLLRYENFGLTNTLHTLKDQFRRPPGTGGTAVVGQSSIAVLNLGDPEVVNIGAAIERNIAQPLVAFNEEIGAATERNIAQSLDPVIGPIITAISGPTFASSGDITITKPTGTTDGDILVAHTYSSDYLATHTLPSGWTRIHSRTSVSDAFATLDYKVAGASEPANYTWTATGNDVRGGAILRITGASRVPIDDSDSAIAQSDSSLNSPGVTSTVDNTLVLRFGSRYTLDSITGVPTGHVEDYLDGSSLLGGIGIGAAHKYLSAPGFTAQASWLVAAGLQDGVGFSLILKPSGVTQTFDLGTATETNVAQPLVAFNEEIGAATERNIAQALTRVAGPIFEAVSTSVFALDGNNLVITKPTGTTEDDLLLAFISSDSSTRNHTNTDGFVQARIDAPFTSLSAEIWTKIAGASEPATYTFVHSGSGGTVHGGNIYRISNINSTTPIEISDFNSNQLSGDPISPSVITTNGRLIIVLCTVGDNDLDGAPPGFVEDFIDETSTGQDMALGGGHRTKFDFGATGTAEWDKLFSDDWMAYTVVIEEFIETGPTPFNVNDISQSNVLDSPTLSQLHVLNQNDISHNQFLDQALFQLQFLLNADELSHLHTITSPIFSAGIPLNINDLTHLHTLDQTSTDVLYTLNQNDINHAQFLETPVISLLFTLATNDITHIQTLDSTLIDLSTQLTINNISQAHTLAQVPFTQIHNVNVNELTHDQTIDPTTGSYIYTLDQNNIAQVHTLAFAGLVQLHNLGTDELSHLHTLDGTTFAQVHNIQVNPLDQQHTLDQASIIFDNIILQIAGLGHNQTLDPSVFSQIHDLVAAGLDQIVILESAGFGLDVTFNVDEFSHQQTIDETSQQLNFPLDVNDLGHTQFLTLSSFSQIHVLNLAELAQQQNIDPATLSVLQQITAEDIAQAQVIDQTFVTETSLRAPPSRRITIVKLDRQAKIGERSSTRSIGANVRKRDVDTHH